MVSFLMGWALEDNISLLKNGLLLGMHSSLPRADPHSRHLQHALGMPLGNVLAGIAVQCLLHAVPEGWLGPKLPAHGCGGARPTKELLSWGCALK